MPGGRLRMEKVGALFSSKRLELSPLTTHIFEGWEHLEEALLLMKSKLRDLIKPVIKLTDR